jgi:hypothetical protein
MKLVLSQENLLQLQTLSSLRVLHLWTADNVGTVGPDSVPGLMLPASLKALFLLSPVQAALMSFVPTTLRSLTITCDVRGPAQGPGSFLSSLDRMLQLTSLFLERGSSFSWPPPGPAYSALTASSRLVRLQLCNVDPGVAGAIWSYVFPSGRKRRRLQWFRHLLPTGNTMWSEAELRRLITCCPKLSDLGVLWLQPGVHASQLRKLTALTGLQVLQASHDFNQSINVTPVAEAQKAHASHSLISRR